MEMHKYVKADTGVEMDMTPMIDIVFLLIIFFMVVTELSNLDIVELILPVADKAVVEEPSPGGRTVVINLQRHDEAEPETRQGQIVVGGDKRDQNELTAYLNREALLFGKFEPIPEDHTKESSLLEINLRADVSVNAGYIHQIYKACQKAKIYKVRLAALNERLENPYEDQ